MPVIKRLERRLVDQIAAGEVVERPASVVKELCENAVDAGATQIEVEIRAGGQELIRIEDNGCGIERDQLGLALDSHATSKLSTVEDLERIGTLGFRGEALASIASVCRLELSSRPTGEEAGAAIEVEGGVRGEVKAVGRPVGTSITVRDLFYNVPARRKFLGSPRGESARIRELVQRFALVHAHCGWKLTSEGKTVISLPADVPISERVGRLFDRTLAARLIETPIEASGVSGHLLLAPPDIQRANRKQQLLFLNGRAVSDRQVSAALAEAYSAYLAPRRFPIWFCFLQLDPAEVDVNVHPRKEEVRIHASRRLFGLLRDTAVRAIEGELAPPSAFDHGPARAPLPPTAGLRESIERYHQRPPLRPRDQSQARLDLGAAPASRTSPAPEDAAPPPAVPAPAPATGASTTPPAASAPTRPHWRGEPPTSAAPTAAAPSPRPRSEPQGPAPVAHQFHQAYLVEQTPDGLAIIDQHALHEKVLYNQLRAAYESGPIARQPLLMPLPVDLPAADYEAVIAAREELAKLGLEVEPFGEGTVAVSAVPALLTKADACVLVETVAERLAGGRPLEAAGALAHDVLASMACKAAIKAGDRLPDEDIARLLTHRDHGGDVYSCPHGRPTTIRMTLDELERRFHRR